MTQALARLALGFLLVLPACGRDAPAPNFVFVTLDTTRADHLGLYGYFRDTSPALDAFGRRSIVFERCIVPMATTLPTHTSLFTATQPLEHGVLANSTQGGSRFVPSARLKSFAQVAGEAGWRTAAFVSSVVLGRGSGIESGFAEFDQPESEAARRGGDHAPPRSPGSKPRRRSRSCSGSTTSTRIGRTLRPRPTQDDVQDRPRAGGADRRESRIPRTVLRPLANQTEETRDSINLYDGELRFQDDQLARLLAALEARPDWERTVVVIAGDHGEGLGQHGEAAHGGTWDEQLHAPLLMRIPGEAPRRVAGAGDDGRCDPDPARPPAPLPARSAAAPGERARRAGSRRALASRLLAGHRSRARRTPDIAGR